MKIGIKGAHLQTHFFDHSLTQAENVLLNFEAPLSAANVSQTGFYLSGVASGAQETTYGITEEQLLENRWAIRPPLT